MVPAKRLLLLLASPLYLTHAIFLPSLSGPHTIGYTSFELNNTSVSPTRDLMVSLFYPTPASTSAHHPQPQSLLPLLSAFTDQYLSLPNGSAATLKMRAHLNAPLSTTYPLLFFSPGYGNSRQWYNVIMSDIASHGYIVVGMDHPNDTAIIEYPDGRAGLYPEVPQPLAAYRTIVNSRVSDIRTIINALSSFPFARKVLPGLRRPLETRSVGIAGSSLGGATAAQTMLLDSRFVAGVNLDGSMLNLTVVMAGLSSPFLLMTNGGRNHLTSTFPDDWDRFWANLRGWKKDVGLQNSTHSHFKDTVWMNETLRNTTLDPLVMGGARALEIQGRFVVSFFDRFLKGKNGTILEGPTPPAAYPDVKFYE